MRQFEDLKIAVAGTETPTPLYRGLIDPPTSLLEQQIEDQHRTEWLEAQGYHVIRFTNEQVLFDIDNVVNKIKFNL